MQHDIEPAASSADESKAPTVEQMDRAYTRFEIRFFRLFRLRCCCDPDAPPLSPADRALRRAFYNGVLLTASSGLAFFGWYLTIPYDLWQRLAAFVQLANCIVSSLAAISLLVVWAPSSLIVECLRPSRQRIPREGSSGTQGALGRVRYRSVRQHRVGAGS